MLTLCEVYKCVLHLAFQSAHDHKENENMSDREEAAAEELSPEQSR